MTKFSSSLTFLHNVFVYVSYIFDLERPNCIHPISYFICMAQMPLAFFLEEVVEEKQNAFLIC